MNKTWIGLLGTMMAGLFGMNTACSIKLGTGGAGGTGSSSSTSSTTSNSSSTTSNSSSTGGSCTNPGMVCLSCAKFIQLAACCSGSNCPTIAQICKGKSTDTYTKLSDCGCSKCVTQCGAKCDGTSKACDDCFAEAVFNGAACSSQRSACNSDT